VNQFSTRSLARRRELEEGDRLLISKALSKWAQRSLSVSAVADESRDAWQHGASSDYAESGLAELGGRALR
jgi:hypothetical protein